LEQRVQNLECRVEGLGVIKPGVPDHPLRFDRPRRAQSSRAIGSDSRSSGGGGGGGDGSVDTGGSPVGVWRRV